LIEIFETYQILMEFEDIWNGTLLHNMVFIQSQQTIEKNVYNHIGPIVYVKNLIEFIWIIWLKMTIQNDWNV
jgi:hypothetical protein